MANNLSTEKQALVISALAECNSIRSIERMTGIHRDTIMRLGVTQPPSAHPAPGQPLAELESWRRARAASTPQQTQVAIAGQGQREARIGWRLIPPRAGIESPFLRTLAPGCAASAPSRQLHAVSTVRSDAPVLL